MNAKSANQIITYKTTHVLLEDYFVPNTTTQETVLHAKMVLICTVEIVSKEQLLTVNCMTKKMK